jgi:predicted dithiol-disulfide oxidoreductase (DUF899 family)
LLQVEPLAAENRILRAHAPARLRLSDTERSTLAEVGKRLGRKGLTKVAQVAKPETIRAFFEPGVFGWPEHACRGCSLGADQVAHLTHLNARDTTLAYASRAPQEDIERLKARMGWKMPWYTITDSFDKDFGVDEWHGHNAFMRDGDKVFRTYFINNRGDEAMGTTWSYLDITALGGQETWEDSPEGYSQTHLISGGTGT